MNQPILFQRLAAWRKAHRFALQVAALFIDIATPFALFAALSAAQIILGAILLALLASGLILTIWAG
jgi:hypothetical protein